MKMADLKCVISFMMFATAVCASSPSELEFTITNGPQDTTVCMNDMAECTCGYDGGNSFLLSTAPNWIIATRSNNGSIINNVTIKGPDILTNVHHGFKWNFGPRNKTSFPNGRLIFGPVNKTHNQSSYQCVLILIVNQFDNESTQLHSVKSSVGTLTVVDPSIGNITVIKTCLTSLSISWNTYSDPACGNLSQSATISSSDARTIPFNDRHFMFSNLSSDTTYTVTITLKTKFATSTTMYTVKTSAPCIPPAVINITTDTDNDDIKITWMMPELNCCVPEIKYYSVTVLSNETSTSKNFTEQEARLSEFLVYHANISFTVIIVAVNSKGSSEPVSTTIGDAKEESSDDDNNESNTAVIVVVVIISILAIIVIVAATIILVYWKYHTKEGDYNEKASKLPMDNSYVASHNTNDNSDLAYAVTGPSSMFTEHRQDANNTTETTNTSIDSTTNYQDVPTKPPQLPPKLNYAELQMADQLPGTIQKDTCVTYAKTIPA